jgi:signal transduction histidine kinase
MRRLSLRSLLLIASIVFAIFVVGAISLLTYVVVADGITSVSENVSHRVAAAVDQVARLQSRLASEQVTSEGLTGTVAESRAHSLLIENLKSIYMNRGSAEPQMAFYDERLQLQWASSESAVLSSESQAAARIRARDTGAQVESLVRRRPFLTGLFARAVLDVQVVHLPLTMPEGGTAVIDVVYYPAREEGAIDAIRAPMAALALFATVVMVLLMQTSLTWVLRLVDNLRQAADAIDAGKLDVRLPIQGENEIGNLALSLNRLIERLRRRSDAQTRFVADASHELATPVAGIRGYVNILRGWGADDPEVRTEAVNAIDRESRRMARLTSELLTLVRSEQALHVRQVRFDVNMAGREALAITASRYAEKNQRFIGPEDGPLIMIGDPDRVEDVVSILLDNAAKYTPPAGRISLATRRRKDTIVIEVSDTGPGISPQDLPMIFERFYRSDTSRTRAEGAGGFGLGLAIARSITDELGGTLAVASRLGLGTTFTFTLPRGRV